MSDLSGRPLLSYMPALAGRAGSGVLWVDRAVPLASPPMRYCGGLRILCDPAREETCSSGRSAVLLHPLV